MQQCLLVTLHIVSFTLVVSFSSGQRIRNEAGAMVQEIKGPDSFGESDSHGHDCLNLYFLQQLIYTLH